MARALCGSRSGDLPRRRDDGVGADGGRRGQRSSCRSVCGRRSSDHQRSVSRRWTAQQQVVQQRDLSAETNCAELACAARRAKRCAEMAERRATLAEAATPRNGVDARCARRGGFDCEGVEPRRKAMKHKVKHIHFVGIGGVGMSGIAEVLLNLGYQVSGSDLSEQRGDRSGWPSSAREVAHRSRARRTSTAPTRSSCRPPCAADNPEVLAARATPYSDRAARDDAGRTDAPEAGHRDRRHARQDHDHEPGRERARRRRARSDLRDRRAAEQRGRERASSAPATSSSPKRTNRTRRS